MSRETEIETLLEADATLMAVLEGGVYSKGNLGPEGITRESAPNAFGANGFLQPTALVRQRDLVPDGWVIDEITQDASAIQVVEIWLYSDISDGYSPIDTAMDRIYALLQGYQLADAFPCRWSNSIIGQRDNGALSGACLNRIDFSIHSVEGV